MWWLSYDVASIVRIRESLKSGRTGVPAEFSERHAARHHAEGRALHSSTFRLNLSAFCGIGLLLGVV